MAEFKEVYTEKGPHDFPIQVKYLSGLADFYFKAGADNSEWTSLLKVRADSKLYTD